jgi:Phage integrase, N-terminal SAM-like domain
MQPKVSLLARVNDGTGKFPQVPCEIHRKAILLPVERKTDGQFLGIKDIIGFYARYSENGKRKSKPLGKDPVSAYTQFQQIEQDFARIQKGLLPLYPSEPKAPLNGRDIHDCAEKYKSRLKTLGKKNSTISQYTLAVDDFVNLYTRKKSSIDQITREDILDYIEWMRSHLVRRQGKGKDSGKGDPQHVYRNRYRHLITFFNHFNVKPPIPMRDSIHAYLWPYLGANHALPENPCIQRVG